MLPSLVFASAVYRFYIQPPQVDLVIYKVFKTYHIDNKLTRVDTVGQGILHLKGIHQIQTGISYHIVGHIGEKGYIIVKNITEVDPF